MALGPTWSLAQWVTGILSGGELNSWAMKLTSRLHPSAKFKNEWSCAIIPCGLPSWHGQGQLYLYNVSGLYDFSRKFV